MTLVSRPGAVLYFQEEAWTIFDEWLKRLSDRFVGGLDDVPLTVLAEWFGKNEPLDETAGRCLDYMIDNL